MNLRNEGMYGLGSAFIPIAANGSDQNSEYRKQCNGSEMFIPDFFPSRISGQESTVSVTLTERIEITNCLKFTEEKEEKSRKHLGKSFFSHYIIGNGS
jgi:hypothetical protein